LVWPAYAFELNTEVPAAAEANALAAWCTSFQDSTTLKACLEKELWGDNDVMYEGWTPWDMAIWFREEAGDLSDEQMSAALMEIYREAEVKGDERSHDLMTRVAQWLGVCADIETKRFLRDVASDASKDGFLRTTSISSYLRSADAQEAKEILTLFLTGTEQMDIIDRYSIYQNAQMAWQESDSTEKKSVIVATLYKALLEEPLPWVFNEGDAILQGMSPSYANSKERLALLERARAYPFPERRERTKRELAERFEKMRKLKTLTSVHTNFVELMEHDFSQPLQESERYLLEMQDASTITATPQSTSPLIGNIKVWALGGGIAGLLGIGAFAYWRRRK
jgi:hypothetical protein